MHLSLSARVAESFSNKREASIGLKDLARIASSAGYRALCMRASVVGIHSPEENAVEVRRILDEMNLEVSMVTGDFAVPENKTEGPGCLRNITPYLDLAQTLRCTLIRICMKTEADIPFAQRSAEEAAERGIRLAHQSHTLSLFETVSGSLDTLRKINCPNFGLIYEPANLALCGEDYGPGPIRAFEPHLFNVYLQNHTPDPTGQKPMETWACGTIMSTLHPLDAPGGIQFQSVFEGLHTIGYTGYIPLQQACGGNLPPEEAAAGSATFLRKLIHPTT
ncbi:MAG: TIM barrel protein [bacterium]|nr:TIM barrel protein [bacterium]